MSWSNRFVGIPYVEFGRSRAGCDCWGLACVIYREDLGIMLPDYLGYGSVDEHAEIAALINGAEASPIWQPVTDPAPYDIVVFRRGRLAAHLAVIIRPGLMIHMAQEDSAKVENYCTGRWGNRLKGHFRHVERIIQ
jgi:probable lipoprotein NlpC